MEFFIDLMSNGLLVGLMYALVAVGFVLIYKAMSILNFAQGDLVMFAGYAAAVMLGLPGLPLWLMVLILCIGMIALGFVLERSILRPMVGQPLVSVIMVTIGLSFVLQGLVAIVWGAATRRLELPVPLAPYVIGPVFISPINVVAAVIALVFWYLEAKWKLFQYALADRIRVIEAYFRNDPNKPEDSPVPFQVYNAWYRSYAKDEPIYEYEKTFRPRSQFARLWAAAMQPFVNALYVAIILLSIISFVLLLSFSAKS